jgi:hypothetical protein
MRERDIMFDQDKTTRLKQAQAMLDLFKTDAGRAASTLDEIKEWASTQGDDKLLLRVERLLSQPKSSLAP